MAEETDDLSPKLTGVVIITLPPPDNPSLGKTITAFTLSDSDHQPSTSQSPHQPQIPLPQSPSSFRTFLHNSPKTVLSVLTLSVIALYVWVSISQQTFFQLRDDAENDNDLRRNKSQHTFVFPLYQKPSRISGELGENELKLGRLVGMKEFEDTMINRRIKPKLASTASKIDAAGVIPVGGNIYPDGLYYTYMHLGNPPRPYFLDMDTGSDLTWIQCDAPCTSCAKGAHPFYKPQKANIIPHKDSYCLEIQRNQLSKGCDSCHQCDYEVEYEDHSSSMGVLARDELFLNIANGSFAKSKVVFGCAYDQQGILLNTLRKTDGILGLSRAKISLPSQLASQGIIKNVLGHCLSTDTSGGSFLFLGNDVVPKQHMTWVPMLQSHDSNFYQTELVKVNYGRKRVGFDSARGGQSRMVFDSGSSYSYFKEVAYNNLVALLNDITRESLVPDLSDTSLPVCWRAKSPLRSVKDLGELFKPLDFEFRSKWWIAGRKLQIPPEGYLVINTNGSVCLGILNGRKVHDGSTFILGDISLRGLLFVYDNMNGNVGWVPSDCTTFQAHSPLF